MKSILITGANRGLGLGMVKYLSQNKKADKIIVTCRQISEDLQKLSASNHVHIVHLDVANISSYGGILEQITKLVGNNGLNVLINNAGIATKFTKLGLVKADQLQENFIVNTVAPIMLTKTLLPLLKQAADSNSGLPLSIHRAAVINMSSVLGSIAQNDKGGFYPYRCSKAALNAATKSMSLDLKKDNIIAVSMHPGWVKTDMGGTSALLDVETSVTGIFNTIEKLEEKDSGKFLQYDGTQLPW